MKHLRKYVGLFSFFSVLFLACAAWSQQTPQATKGDMTGAKAGDTCSCQCGDQRFEAALLSAFMERRQPPDLQREMTTVRREGFVEGAEEPTIIELRRPVAGRRGPVVVGVGLGETEGGCPDCDIVGWLRCMDGCDFHWCESLCDILHRCCVQ